MHRLDKPASLLDVVKMVAFGFLGVRRRADHERARVRPVQVIVAALVFVVLFILAIRAVVHIVTS